MIEEGLDQPWPPEVRAAVEQFRQGHLIEKPPLFYAAGLRHPIWHATRSVADCVPEHERGEEFIDVLAEQRPAYGIVTTQGCDLAEERPSPRQPWLAVAPVYELKAGAITLLDREYIYELAAVGIEGGPWVADLRIEMPLEKSLLVGRTPIDAFSDERGYIEFARFLARRRGRPALASVVHDVLTVVMRRLKEEDKDQLRLARRARGNIYKLKLAIEEGTYSTPVAIKLYVITGGEPTEETRALFDLWWNAARLVADKHGLQLLPTGWMSADALDARLYDELIEMRSPV